MKISVVIPAYNVESTIKNVCIAILNSPLVDEIIVVDNNSTDLTGYIANKYTNKVIKCLPQGLGFAMKAGIKETKNDIVIKIDGDIKNPKTDWIKLLFSALNTNTIFANGYFFSEYDEFPVGNLVAKPSLKIKFPELDYVRMPLSGQYIFLKKYFDLNNIPNDWAFDLAMLLSAHKQNTKIGQVDIGLLSDEQKKISDYSIMAYELIKFIFNEN